MSFLKKMFAGDTILGSALTITNNIIGAGVLFLPYIFNDMGVIIGFLFMVFGNLLVVSFNFLLISALNAARKKYPDTPPESVEELLTLSFSGRISKPLAFLIVKFCVFLFIFGITVSYQIVLTEMVISILYIFFKTPFFDIESLRCRFVVGGVVMIILCIFSLVKKVRNLRIVSFVSISVVISLLVIMFFLIVTGFTKPMSSGEVFFIPDLSDYLSWIKMAKYGGILSFATMNLVVAKIHSEFKAENLYKMKYAISLSYFLVFLVYSSIAVIGYFSFLDNTKENIILSYESEDMTTYQLVVSILLRILTFLQLFLTYPVLNNVMSQVSFELVKKVLMFIKMVVFDKKNKMKKKGGGLDLPSSFSSASSSVDIDDDESNNNNNEDSTKEEEEDDDSQLDTSFDSMSTDEELIDMLNMSSSNEALEEGGEEEEEKISSSSEEKTVFEKLGMDKSYLLFSFLSLFNTISFGIIAILYPKAKNVVGYVGGVPGLFFLVIIPLISWLRLVDYKWYKGGILVVLYALFSVIFLGVISNTIQLLDDFGVLKTNDIVDSYMNMY